MLQQIIIHTLDEVVDLLEQLSEKQFNMPNIALSNSTVGQHTRHIIEMFQCLIQQYDTGKVNYDHRERNINIETQPQYAIDCIHAIQQDIYQQNKHLTLYQEIGGIQTLINTNFERELLYNLEHCIHHQALIRVAIRTFPDINVSDNFGVAPSTIQYKLQCAQ